MNYFENIFDEFKDGTDEERLDLYLHHRNLRTELDKIEDEEISLVKAEKTDSTQLVIKPGRVNEQHPLFVRMKQWCLSVLS